MTTPEKATSDFGKFGVFVLGGVFSGGATPEQAQEIERLGYGTLWVSGSPPAELSFAEPLLESTTVLKVATGVVNIWSADAKTVASRSTASIPPIPADSYSASAPAIPSTPGNTASPTTRWSTTSTSLTNTACRPISVCSPRSGPAC